MQRGVHRRANTLSRHKYLAGEQVRSLNSGGERQSAGRLRRCLRVHTRREDRWFSTTQFPGCLAQGRSGRPAKEAEGGRRRAGVNLSHFQITHWRYSHLHGRLANLCLVLPRVRSLRPRAFRHEHTSMPITPSELHTSLPSREATKTNPPDAPLRDRAKLPGVINRLAFLFVALE